MKVESIVGKNKNIHDRVHYSCLDTLRDRSGPHHIQRHTMSFGYFKRKKTPNYPKEARRSAIRSRENQARMKSRRPSALRSIAHRNMLQAKVERKREMQLYAQEIKQRKIKVFVDHKIFPGLIARGDDNTQVIDIQSRSPNMARSQSATLSSGTLGTIHVTGGMPSPKIRLSRNELLESALPGIDYLLRFKRAAFEKAHCPLPEPGNYSPSKNRYDTGKAPKPYSTSASADVESLRKKEEKHGRGWMADPYLDSNPGCVATYGCGRENSSINFRNYQPLDKSNGKLDFTCRTSASAKDLIVGKEWMTLSSPGMF